MSEKIDNISVTTKANIYFDGKCISYSLTESDGTRKSVGVVMPAALTFSTGAPEVMETVSGACRYKLPGEEWKTCPAGESFSIPGDTSFDIEVTGEPYHYICHYD